MKLKHLSNKYCKVFIFKVLNKSPIFVFSCSLGCLSNPKALSAKF